MTRPMTDTSQHPSLPPRSGLFSYYDSNDTGTTSSSEEEVNMQDVSYLNEQLQHTRQELKRSKNDCDRLNHALTSMVDYFTKDSAALSSTAVASSLVDEQTSKTSKPTQPIISFDDDDFEHHLHNDKGSHNWDGTLLESVCTDLVSVSISEPSDSWSSCATRCSSFSTPEAHVEVLPRTRLRRDAICAHDTTQDAATTVAGLENEMMEMAIVDDDSKEDGEIIEAPSQVIEVMPANFWKYWPDSPHPRNYLNLGITFTPGPEDENEIIGADDTRKTVLIQNLPPGTSTIRLLENVRGGIVVSCTVVPAARLQGYDAAYVQFADASTAASYADFARAHPLFISGWPLVVSHLKSATYPLSPAIHDTVHRYGATRCLRIFGLSSAAQLYGILLRHFRTPLVIEAVYDDPESQKHQKAIIAAFAGVEIAGRAWWLLKYAPSAPFVNCGNALRIEYLPDPCAEPLSTLLFRMGEDCGRSRKREREFDVYREGRDRKRERGSNGGGWDEGIDEGEVYLDY